MNLKKFGITMGTAFSVIGLLLLMRHKPAAPGAFAAAAAFFALAFLFPSVLRPVYIIWMKFASLLGWINTRIIFFLIFYLVFTPAGLVMRLFGKDPLDRKIDKKKTSYWLKKEKEEWSPVSHERQF